MTKLSGLALKTLVGVAAGAFIAGSAHAADLPPAALAEVVPAWDLAFGVAGVTDYVFRGISNSSRHPAVQGYAELQVADWVYAGVWMSSVDFPVSKGLTDPAAEIDLYGGIRHTWDSFSLDVGGLYYEYPNEKGPGIRLDYWELYAKPSIAFGDFGSIAGNLYWTSDFVGTKDDALYLSVIPKINIPLTAIPDVAFYVSGELGKQWVENKKASLAKDYLTWNVGVGATYKAMTLDVRYSDTDLSKNECLTRNAGSRNWCGSTVVGKISFDTSFNKLK